MEINHERLNDGYFITSVVQAVSASKNRGRWSGPISIHGVISVFSSIMKHFSLLQESKKTITEEIYVPNGSY